MMMMRVNKIPRTSHQGCIQACEVPHAFTSGFSSCRLHHLRADLVDLDVDSASAAIRPGCSRYLRGPVLHMAHLHVAWTDRIRSPAPALGVAASFTDAPDPRYTQNS